MLASEENTKPDLVLTLPILRLINPIESWLGENKADLIIATTVRLTPNFLPRMPLSRSGVTVGALQLCSPAL